MLKINDFFCGAGGMGLGFKQAGFTITGAWDFDEHAVKSYKHNVDSNVIQQDITALKGEEVPVADVWSFGFPCQDISISGGRAGMVQGETRSGMFYEIMRLLKEVKEKPTFIIAENVKNVKKLLPEIEKEYKLAGYRMEERILNSKGFGVAQHRERYFIVGIRDDLNINFQFPEEDAESTPYLYQILENNVDASYYYEDTSEVKLLQPEPTKLEAKLIVAADLNRYKNDQMNRVHSVYGIAPTALTVSGGGKEIKIIEQYSPLLVRKLTAREYARLQGFPDSYEIVVSKTQAYKQFGNAVTVTVAKAVAEQIKIALKAIL